METKRKQNEPHVARGMELAALALVLVWIAELLVGGAATTSYGALIRVAIATLAALLFAVGAVSFVVPARLPEEPRRLSRPERDAGLGIGCVLVPLVLLSQVTLQLHQDSAISGFAFLYVWTSISVGVSAFIRFAVLQSSSLRVGIIVDVLLLPALFHVAGIVELGSATVLPTACRCVVSAVLSYGMHALPRSFTLGEALLAAQGVGITAFDLVLVTLTQIQEAHTGGNFNLSPFFHAWEITSVNRDDHVLALQVGMLGSLLVCVALAPVLRSHGASSPTQIAAPLPLPQCVEVAVRCVVIIVGVVYPWSCVVLKTWNPFQWLLQFLLARPARGALIVYWVACLVLLVPLFAWLMARFAIRNIIARKLFHILVVVMFVPAFFSDASMLSLSYGVALSVFCLVECIRALAIPPFGAHIADFMKAFIDHRDGGRTILTHSYLLVGCALPLWLSTSSSSQAQHQHALAANAGIIALGIGDAMGAAVGSVFGKRRLIGSKTLEGTLAIAVSMAVASLLFCVVMQDAFHVVQLSLLLLGVVVTSVLETCTAQIDNLVLPLFFFAVCNLVTCHL